MLRHSPAVGPDRSPTLTALRACRSRSSTSTWRALLARSESDRPDRSSPAPDRARASLTIVGIAGNVRPAHRLDTVPQIYVSYLQQSEPNITLLVRPPPASTCRSIRSSARSGRSCRRSRSTTFSRSTSVLDRAMAEPRLMTAPAGQLRGARAADVDAWRLHRRQLSDRATHQRGGVAARDRRERAATCSACWACRRCDGRCSGWRSAWSGAIAAANADQSRWHHLRHAARRHPAGAVRR